MREETLVIANPAAGAGRGRERVRGLVHALDGWSPPPRLLWTERPGHARELARGARERGVRMVVAAGGDGTVHEVVNGLLDAGLGDVPTFGCLPVGTGGDFARSLGLAGDVTAQAVALGQGGRRLRVDVGRVSLAGAGDDEWFVNAANVGLGARVAARVTGSSMLRRLGEVAYVLATLRTLPGYRPVPVRVKVPGRPAWTGAALNVSVCNGPYFGGGMRPVPEASLTTGTLHVVVVRPMALPRASVQLARVLTGRRPDPERVVVMEGRAVELESTVPGAAVDVEVDGEVPGSLPARFELAAGALPVLVPERAPSVRPRPD